MTNSLTLAFAGAADDALLEGAFYNNWAGLRAERSTAESSQTTMRLHLACLVNTKSRIHTHTPPHAVPIADSLLLLQSLKTSGLVCVRGLVVADLAGSCSRTRRKRCTRNEGRKEQGQTRHKLLQRKSVCCAVALAACTLGQTYLRWRGRLRTSAGCESADRCWWRGVQRTSACP